MRDWTEMEPKWSPNRIQKSSTFRNIPEKRHPQNGTKKKCRTEPPKTILVSISVSPGSNFGLVGDEGVQFLIQFGFKAVPLDLTRPAPGGCGGYFWSKIATWTSQVQLILWFLTFWGDAEKAWFWDTFPMDQKIKPWSVKLSKKGLRRFGGVKFLGWRGPLEQLKIGPFDH